VEFEVSEKAEVTEETNVELTLEQQKAAVGDGFSERRPATCR
jgi:hypothetical protein